MRVFLTTSGNVTSFQGCHVHVVSGHVANFLLATCHWECHVRNGGHVWNGGHVRDGVNGHVASVIMSTWSMLLRVDQIAAL